MSFESDLATLRQQAEAWAGESTTRNLTTMHAALVKAAAANPQPPEPAGPPYTADDATATATTLGLGALTDLARSYSLVIQFGQAILTRDDPDA